MKIKANAKWKTVKLEDNLIARGITRDFIGIEELRDYKLVKSTKSARVVPKDTEAKKKEEANSKDNVSGNSEAEKVPKSTKKKKMKKEKKKGAGSKINTEEGEPEDDSPKIEVKAAEERPPTEKKKPKKKKAKGKASAEPSTLAEDTPAAEISNQKAKANKAKKRKVTKASASKEDKQELNEESVEPEVKRSKNNESSDEEEDDETVVEAENENESFEVTPDMMIWKAMFLPDPIIRAVWELGFENPTAIQLAVLPTAMKGRRDVVGAAETGSGKTLAFGIPILYGIMKDKEFEQKKKSQQEAEESEDGEAEAEPDAEHSEVDDKGEMGEEEEETEMQGIGCVRVMEDVDFNLNPIQRAEKKTKLRAVIITPTRELAVQIEKHLRAIAKYTGVTMALVIGGMAAPKQERLLSKGPDIVIGTPGRLWELIEGGNPHLSQVNDVRYLALDETDRLLEQGHFAELRTLLEHINKDEARKRWRQNFVFSATLTLAHDLPSRLGNIKHRKKKEAVKLDKLLNMVGVRPKAKIVDLTAAAKTLKPATLSEMKLYSATIEDKDYYLYYFLRHNPGRTLVFCNSINNVRRLTSVFQLLGMNPLALHAQMQQRQRLKHLERFTGTENALLIATDVAARGLDIPHVQHVVHFQVPRTSENYVHRSGRTARASRDGLSLILVEPSETALYRKLCTNLKKDKQDLPDYDVDMRLMSAVKQRVNLARAIEHLEHKTKRERSDVNWVKKMAEEADLVLDDEDAPSDDDGGGSAHQHAQLLTELKTKRNELSKLLSRPLKRSIN